MTQADLLTPREARADGMERALRGADERIKRIARAAIVLCIEIGRPFTTDQVEQSRVAELLGARVRWVGDSPLPERWERQGYVGTVHTVEVQ